MCWLHCVVVDESNRNPEALKKILQQLDVVPERRLARRKQTDSQNLAQNLAAQRLAARRGADSQTARSPKGVPTGADVMHAQGQQQARH